MFQNEVPFFLGLQSNNMEIPNWRHSLLIHKHQRETFQVNLFLLENLTNMTLTNKTLKNKLHISTLFPWGNSSWPQYISKYRIFKTYTVCCIVLQYDHMEIFLHLLPNKNKRWFHLRENVWISLSGLLHIYFDSLCRQRNTFPGTKVVHQSPTLCQHLHNHN